MPGHLKACQIDTSQWHIILQPCTALGLEGALLASILLCPVYSDGQSEKSHGVDTFPSR